MPDPTAPDMEELVEVLRRSGSTAKPDQRGPKASPSLNLNPPTESPNHEPG